MSDTGKTMQTRIYRGLGLSMSGACLGAVWLGTAVNPVVGGLLAAAFAYAGGSGASYLEGRNRGLAEAAKPQPLPPT